MRNKALLILSAGLLLNLLCFTMVSAFSISKATAVNTFTVGDNKIEINEVFEPPVQIEEGDEIRKEVAVTNTGRTPCSVRLFVVPDDMDIMNKIAIDFDSVSWEGDGAGFYYYKHLLLPGERTENLFSKVDIHSGTDGFCLCVYGESRTALAGQTWSDVWADKLIGKEGY